ncbi:MAG: hypothetical protein AB7U81_06055 [Thiohalomonadaceae bacterium]
MSATPFLAAFRGNFKNMLRWEQLEGLWATVRAQAAGQWYVYAVGEAVPTAPVDDVRLDTFLTEVDALLRREHDEDYCGIVYVDDPARPGFIKIYDPGNLGSVCGSGSQPPPLPGWILCTMPPEDLKAAYQPAGNRRRWWQRILGG